VRLRADLDGILAGDPASPAEPAPGAGEWRELMLRAAEASASRGRVVPAAERGFVDTPLLARCAHVRQLLGFFQCPLRAVRFLRLAPGAVSAERGVRQAGFAAGVVQLHVPVRTHSAVRFTLGGRRVEMTAGDCWYLDLTRPHRAANHGPTDCVHLVIECGLNDWLRELLLAESIATRRSVAISRAAAR
jgi:hypothetical protein